MCVKGCGWSSLPPSQDGSLKQCQSRFAQKAGPRQPGDWLANWGLDAFESKPRVTPCAVAARKPLEDANVYTHENKGKDDRANLGG